MKCEKCNDKEATFYYSSNINGEKTEKHLCADCAREEGFGGALDYRPTTMFGSMFDDVFDDFFAPERSLLRPFGSFGLPYRSIMAPVLPRVNIVVGQPEKAECAEQAETKIPTDVGDDVKMRRQVQALKEQLADAVKEENFEKAIELRDQLKKLENK
jgi:protein arginine kinase activator